MLQALVFFVLASFLEMLGGLVLIPGLGGIGTTLAIISFVFFILILLGGVLMFVKPAQAKIWGVVTLVFSVIGFIFLGGLIIGSILGLVGGILGIVWKPPMQPTMAPTAPPTPPP